MGRIKITKFLAHRQEISLIIKGVIHGIDTPITIVDKNRVIIIGDKQNDNLCKYPIKADEQVIGWVLGSPKALSVAKMLNYLITKELEKNPALPYLG
ncbi:MAG: hypothetical protein F6K10_11310 [Moorea sp. SIO2B7]|nr:hypothetical protein [Moorena sp. SIO2B7]